MPPAEERRRVERQARGQVAADVVMHFAGDARALDFLGFLPTIRKSYAKPYEETLITYMLSGLKFLLAIIALPAMLMVRLLPSTSSLVKVSARLCDLVSILNFHLLSL